MLPENQINTSPDSNGEAEHIAVDLDATVEVEDATADGNIAAPIPPAGLYPVKWADQEEKGLAGAATNSSPSRSYVGGNIIGRVVASGESFDEFPVYEYINSLTMRGKPTSDLHHFLNCAGSPAPNRCTVRELLTFAQNVLAENPAVQTFLDWKASYPHPTETQKNGKPKYIEVATSMEKFPKEIVDGKWTGKRLQQVPHPITGEAINAQVYVRAFYTEAEAKKKMAKAS